MTHRGIETTIKRITPAEAEKLLESNSVNRGLRRGTVDAYRRDMEAGRWMMTGEPLQFSRSGRLMNGQHRLTALAGSTVPWIEFIVITGLPDEAQVMMDQGAGRSAVDALQIAHGGAVRNVATVAAVCRWLVAHPDPGMPNMLVSLKRKVSSAECVAMYDENPDIQVAVNRATGMRPHIYTSPSPIAYVFFHTHRIDPIATNEFFGAMMDMAFSVKDDPRKAALRRLQVLATQDSERRADKGSSVMVISVLTRAWNAWRKGEEVRSFSVRNNRNEPVPSVRPV